MKNTLLILSAALLAAPAWANDDAAALKLATNAGCMTCHHLEPGAKGPNGLPPIGPAWRDVAAKYKSVKGAQQQLTATVMTGSLPADQGRSPYASHWTGKVQGDFMPTHRHAVTQADAARIVAWILALDPLK